MTSLPTHLAHLVKKRYNLTIQPLAPTQIASFFAQL